MSEVAGAVRYPGNLANQFMIERDPASDRLTIVSGTQPTIAVVDAEGVPVGTLVGTPIDLDAGTLVASPHRLSFRVAEGGASVANRIEDAIYAFSGSFLFVLDLPDFQRVYLDADGSLSLVYDPERQIAGSTAAMLLDAEAYAARFDHELYDYLAIRRDGWFPAGLTVHRGVRRLMCNHYLDFATFEAVRHWPLGRVKPSADPVAAVGAIMDETRCAVAALIAHGPAVATLTAGNETRMILAACRGLETHLEYVTVDGPETRLDVHRAMEIASACGLRHRRLPIRHASDEAAEEWHARAGHCVGGPNMRSHPSVAPLARDFRHMIGGLGGEIGRGFFWRATDNEGTEVTAQSIVARFGMPFHPRVLAVVEDWLARVGETDPFLILDLAYLELRMSCWAFAQAYSSDAVTQIHPLISRANYTAMLSLPPAWRRENRMVLNGIEQRWPELLRWPINRYGDYRDTLRALGRVARNPRLVVKKLRKRFR